MLKSVFLKFIFECYLFETTLQNSCLSHMNTFGLWWLEHNRSFINSLTIQKHLAVYSQTHHSRVAAAFTSRCIILFIFRLHLIIFRSVAINLCTAGVMHVLNFVFEIQEKQLIQCASMCSHTAFLMKTCQKHHCCYRSSCH